MKRCAPVGRAAALSGLALSVAACAYEPIPAYPTLSPAQSLLLIVDRQHRLRTVRAQGTVTLLRPDGNSVSFDGALVSRGPRAVRLRAWKFGQAAFDLTVDARGVWLLADEEHSKGQDSPAPTASGFSRAWELVVGDFLDRPGDAPEESDTRLIVTRTIDTSRVRCTIDRATLTPRVYEVFDEHGDPVARLELSRYRSVGDTVWPMRVRASGTAGTITADLDDVEINADLPESAFTPPARASLQP